MPAYKLYYFPIRARGEPIRLLFTAAGVDFDDVRVSEGDWSNMKGKMLFRQLPVLEVDGKQISQSSAILRYLANEFGLAGKDKWEAAEADQFFGAVDDMFSLTGKVYFDKDEARKAEALQKYKDEGAPSILKAFEDKLSTSSLGFLVGDGLTYADLSLLNLSSYIQLTYADLSLLNLSSYIQLTYADLSLLNLSSYIQLTYADLSLLNLLDVIESSLKEDGMAVIKQYPNIQKHRQKIRALPRIAAWLDKRPDSEY